MSGETPSIIGNRYRLKGEPIGRGGMGVVYCAYDTVTQRDVALKTLRAMEPLAFELFRKEWTVLARLSHPNIVDIIDSGEFEIEGETRPYFVMPLLPGVTLDRLIKNASPRLTAPRVAEMMAQTSKGLQAAHDRGLIHRDLKPSNIFVMDDDSVKIIDFGVVHLADGKSVTGIKGSLPYMAPELIQLRPASPASDIFALGVVCYEALTGRNPFLRQTESETAQAIRTFIPPPATEINAAVNELVSRVVHKAMAKDQSYRFSSPGEFAAALLRAVRNEAADAFDKVNIAPRIERVKKACTDGDYQFGAEILSELESEGHLDPQIGLLRGKVDQALRQKSVRQLLDSARVRIDEGELPLAQQKIQDALEIDPDNTEATALRAEAERLRGARQIEKWHSLVQQHMDNHLFEQARQALGEILKLDPTDSKARHKLASVARLEQEFLAARKEKEDLYNSAMRAYQNGDISIALEKLEHILRLTQTAGSSTIPDREAEYQRFYNQVRTERDEYRTAQNDAQRLLAERKFEAALEYCDRYLAKYSGDPLFQALKLEVEEQQRQEQSGFVAEVNTRVDAEADLDRKCSILSEAAARFPKEHHFQQALRLARERRDLVNGIVAKARSGEERGQYSEALAQWDILRNIYGQYPGLDYEIERVRRRRETQARDDGKARWVQRIDSELANGGYTRAQELAASALAEYPDDRELTSLARLAAQAVEKGAEAEAACVEGRRLWTERRFAEGIEKLREARKLDERNTSIAAALVDALVEHARPIVNADWHTAEPLIREAMDLDANHPGAKSLSSLIEDYKRQEQVENLICQAREMQAEGHSDQALAAVEQGLQKFPHDPRLSQLRTTLLSLFPEVKRKQMREDFLKQLKALVAQADQARDAEADTLLEQSRVLARRFPDDPEFCTLVTEIGRRVAVANPSALVSAAAAGSEAPTRLASPGAVDDQLPPTVAIEKPPDADRPRANTPATDASAAQRPPRARPSAIKFRPVWAICGMAAVLLPAAYVVHRRNARAPESPLHELAYEVRANVARFTALFDPKPSGAGLTPGTTYRIEVSADGYKTAVQTYTAPPAASSPLILPFQLEPEPVRLLVSGDPKWKVFVDNQEIPQQEGIFARDDLQPSAHSVRVTDSDRELLSFSFTAMAGELPVLSGQIQAKDVQATVVSSFVNRARIYATPGVKGAKKDSAPDAIPPDGLAIDNLNAATAEAQFDSGKGVYSDPIDLGNTPRIAVKLVSDRNVGYIVVSVNVPSAEVYIDGKLKRGRTRTYPTPPGSHRVQVVAPGFETSAEQTVEVKKGENTKSLVFELQPVVTTGVLHVENGVADADILLDSERVGRVAPDGTFRLENVAPGRHEIVLRKQNFEDTRATVEFKVKETTRLNGRMRQFGALAIHVTPPQATVTYRLAGEQPVSTNAERTISVRSGSYEVEATAPGYQPKRTVVDIQPGQTAPANLALVALPVPDGQKRGAERRISSEALDSASWRRTDDGWSTRGPSGYGWSTANTGVFDIQIRQVKGKVLGLVSRNKRVEFVADYVDDRNLVLYSWDWQNLTVREISQGKAKADRKQSMKAGDGSGVKFELEITAEKIIVRQDGREIDAVSRNVSRSPGKFGFKGEAEVKVTRR